MNLRRTLRATRGALAASLVALAAVLVVGFAAGALAPRDSEAQRSARGYLGVSLQELDDELRDSYDYHGDGVLVSAVSDDSPAERVGVREGDILMKIGDREVDGVRDATDYVRSLEPGTKVAITVFRSGNQRALGQATIADLDDSWERSTPRAPRAPRAPRPPRVVTPRVAPHPEVRAFTMGGRGRLGVQTHDLDSDLGGYFKAPGNRGVLVLEVVEDTPAAKAGIKGGDVILKVGTQEIEDTDALRRALRDRDAGPVAIEVLRNGTRRTLSADLEERGGRWNFDGFEGMPGHGPWMAWLDGKDFDFDFDWDDGELLKDGQKIKHHVFRFDGDGDEKSRAWIWDGDDWRDQLTPEERAKFDAQMKKLREDMRELRRDLREDLDRDRDSDSNDDDDDEES